MASSGNSKDLVVVDSVRENTLVLKSGGLRQVIMVGGTNFLLKSEMEQQAISEGYQNFLNSLDFPVQIIVHSRKVNIERYLKKLEDRRGNEPSGILQNQMVEYQSFVRGFVAENPIMRKVFLVLVPLDVLDIPSKETVSGLFSFFKKSKPEKEEVPPADPGEIASFEKHLSQLTQRTNQVIEGLRAIGLETAVLNNQQLVELFYNFYNPETVERDATTTPPSHSSRPSAPPSS